MRVQENTTPPSPTDRTRSQRFSVRNVPESIRSLFHRMLQHLPEIHPVFLLWWFFHSFSIRYLCPLMGLFCKESPSRAVVGARLRRVISNFFFVVISNSSALPFIPLGISTFKFLDHIILPFWDFKFLFRRVFKFQILRRNHSLCPSLTIKFLTPLAS